MVFDYEILRIIWWFLLGFLLVGFAIMGGIDLGVGALLPFVAKNNIERRIAINSIAPTWDGNQVWFIFAGGAIFAAWPYVYAVAFSTFYFALFLILVALILRPVGFDFRSKINNETWRLVWDICIFIGGFVPTLVFGIAIGNVMQGISFSFDNFLFLKNEVSFLSLFSPFTILCGLVSVCMIITQGAIFLVMKTDKDVMQRSKLVASITPLITIILFAIGGYMLKNIDGFAIENIASKSADSNPLLKEVVTYKGAWLNNYTLYPWTMVFPILAIAAAILVPIVLRFRILSLAFFFNSLSIASIIATFGFSTFPFILPSNTHYNSSLTVWDASSSYNALLIMLVIVVVFMPIVLSYVSWVYKVMFGKIKESYIKKESKNLY